MQLTSYLQGLRLPILSPAKYHMLSSNVHDRVVVVDNLHGFDDNFQNHWLDQVRDPIEIVWHQFVIDEVKQRYPHITFQYDPLLHHDFYTNDKINIRSLPEYQTYQTSPDHLLCCFNCSGHVGRQFLVAALNKMDLWSAETCTKLFSTSRSQIDGNIELFSNTQERFFRKFIIDDSGDSDAFYECEHNRPPRIPDDFSYDEIIVAIQDLRFGNLFRVLPMMSKSFLNLVSETIPTSSQPYFTEKFLFPIVTGNFWLAYAQHSYHTWIEKAFGFKNYSIFDYSFDSIRDPLSRLLNLLSMIKKFQILSHHDLTDLYHLERDTIEFNQHHYFSGDYLDNLKTIAIQINLER